MNYRKLNNKKHYYNICEVCGCSLDPNEGYICSDCKEQQNNKPIIKTDKQVKSKPM